MSESNAASLRVTPEPALAEDKHHSKGELIPEECWWRDRYQWLMGQGYLLRSRYRPDWVPSWKGISKAYWKCEDGQTILVPHLLDATETSGGKQVMLKRILTREHPHEVKITKFLSSEPLASDLHNHSVPLLDLLKVPDDNDTVILVMPLLRRYDSPPFETVGEAVDFFCQIFEGLQFMHHQHVAHRDCMNQNILLDPTQLFSEPYHPRVIDYARDLSRPVKHHTRTSHPVRYYFIDFGLSRRYSASDGRPREPAIMGGDKSVPEFRDSKGEPCDPFPTDVYYLGNLVREDFLQRYHGVQFMQPLIDTMVQDEPEKRPTIDEVVSCFEEIRATLKGSKLRARLVDRGEGKVERMVKGVKHVLGNVRSVSGSYTQAHEEAKAVEA